MLVRQVEGFDGGSLCVMGVLENTHVDADALPRIFGLCKLVFRGFDTEDSIPLTSRLLYDNDSLYFGVLG